MLDRDIHGNLAMPTDARVITWNYDGQFEKSFADFFDNFDHRREVGSMLQVTPATGTFTDYYDDIFSIYRINGVAGIRERSGQMLTHYISDLSTFIGSVKPSTHRILAGGDLNMDYGSLDNSWESLALRARTVYDRMEALGLQYMGPQFPAGRKADPIPKELPKDTLNVPTFHSSRGTPATAAVQLDHVFASKGFHEGVRVRALNGVAEWGPSDHCRLMIEVSTDTGFDSGRA